jgi:hypothetical protein
MGRGELFITNFTVSFPQPGLGPTSSHHRNAHQRIDFVHRLEIEQRGGLAASLSY